MVTFFAQVQHELYLLTLFIPMILPMISLLVETGSVSLKGSADSMLHSDSCFGVFISTSDLDLF